MTSLQANTLSGASKSAPPPLPRPSRLMAGIYHDIGLAAVARVLETRVEELDGEMADAVRRGVRYINLMPRTK